MFLTESITNPSDVVVAALIGVIIFVIRKTDRVENEMIMDMIPVNMRSQHKLIFPTQDLFGQLHPDLMGLFRRDFSRFEGLD